MAGLIERNARIRLTLQQPTGEIRDGQSVFGNIPAFGIILDFSQRDFEAFGTVKNGRKILLAPLDRTPLLPGRVVYEGEAYEIQSVKTLRNLRGDVLGYRIIAAGG